jgi:hypothetical protein
MAASGATPIILYHSTTGAAVPSNTNLAPGELAVNIADMKLYCENSSGVVTLLSSADAAAGNFTTVDTTNIEVTNIKAKDGTASIVLTDSTGDAAFSSTGAVKVSVGTLAQRPAVPVAGQLRFNDDSDEFEVTTAQPGLLSVVQQSRMTPRLPPICFPFMWMLRQVRLRMYTPATPSTCSNPARVNSRSRLL